MALKILHTSDFHIGKQLLKVDFLEDMELFFDWLIKVIKEEKIDVLLMSGDLFDQANPSQQAMRQYYMF
jgi:exonuclease SbcD